MYHLVGRASLGSFTTQSLLLLVLLPTLLYAWHVWQDGSLIKIRTSIMIPQASLPDEDPAITIVGQDAPAREKSSQPTDVDEANDVGGQGTMDCHVSSELIIMAELQDLLARGIARSHVLQLMIQMLSLIRTYEENEEVDATRPVIPDMTNDSTINNALQFEEHQSSNRYT